MTRRAGFLFLVFGLAGSLHAQDRKPDFSFGLLADCQYEDKDTRGARNYRGGLENLKACVADLNTKQLEFVIQLGDFIDGGKESLDRVLAVYNRLKARRRHVLGNHDFALGYPTVLRKLGLEKGYTDFAVRGWRFIAVDGNEIGLSAWRKGSPEHDRALKVKKEIEARTGGRCGTFSGGPGPEQVAWLKGVLADARKKGQKAVLFCHFPLHRNSMKSKSEDYLVWNHREVRPIVESAGCVVAWIAGHYHKGGYAFENGIHHVTVPGMVEAPLGKNAYAVVDAYADRLEIRGVGTVPSRTLRRAER